MAATTIRPGGSVHGGNPQYLIEKVIRARIYETLYWKESCFALNAESLIDRAIELQAIGGVTDRQTPTAFMCLTLKLLQLQPDKEILLEYLLAEEFKYLRALAAFYIRLTFRSMEIYETLEPLMKDYRKLRVRHVGGYSLTHFDEFIDELLTQDRVCDIILPRLTQRSVLEETEGLAPRKSLLVSHHVLFTFQHTVVPTSDLAPPSSTSILMLQDDAPAEIDVQPDSPHKRPRLSSRTPSRTPPSSRGSSPDLRKRGRSESESSGSERGARYVSRSPSPGSGSEDGGGEKGDTRGRYVSRSPSFTPDRQMEIDGPAAAGGDDDRIEGDV